MLLANIILTAVLTVTNTPVEAGLVCPNKKAGIQRFIEARLTRQRYGSKRYRKTLTTQLSNRIVIESKRFKLDPLVMTTIAWIESDFQPSVRGRYGGATGRGRRLNEVGVFQLIPFDSMVKAAATSIFGCKSTRLMRWQRRTWARRYRGKACLYPDMGALRTRPGQFSRSELKSIGIGTFVAAFEMRGHIDACKARRPNGHRWHAPRWFKRWVKANPKVSVTALERYLHYNWGSKQLPKSLYRKKLFVRYSKVRRGVCKHSTRVASIITR